MRNAEQEYNNDANEHFQHMRKQMQEAYESTEDDDPKMPIIMDGPHEIRCIGVQVRPGENLLFFFDGDGDVDEGYYLYREFPFSGRVFQITDRQELEQWVAVFGLDGWDWSTKR